MPKESNLAKINKIPIKNAEFKKKSDIINMNVLNDDEMNYVSYVFMNIFSMCCSKYNDKLLMYSRSQSFSKNLISFKNYLRISFKEATEVNIVDRNNND